jgi:hypothetical protein
MKRFFTKVTATCLALALLITSGCFLTSEDTEIFDFLGTWTLTTTYENEIASNLITFEGTLTSGTVDMEVIDSGTYTSADNAITITFYLGSIVYSLSGTVTSANFMSGTFTTNITASPGTWQATR